MRDHPDIDEVRDIFGDDRMGYTQALQRYYAEGPPTDCQESFVSPYASVHPGRSGKQGDTLLGFSVRELSSRGVGALALFGVRRFPRLWLCLTPHCSAVLPIDTAHPPQRACASS